MYGKEALCHELMLYDAVVRLLDGIQSIYVNSSPSVRVKGVRSESFRIDSSVR